jgi:hypothetical protein
MEIIRRTQGISTDEMDDKELSEKEGMLTAFQEIINFIH